MKYYSRIIANRVMKNAPQYHLTLEEFEVMKTHAEKGAEIVNEQEQMQDANVHQFSYEICKCHHEKYDGRGCSRRLKGDEIPIASQIVSLAEVFDVLMSSRIYKKAFSCDQAFTMIVKGECSAFSQIMMQCLMKCLGELKKIKAEYEDKNKQP